MIVKCKGCGAEFEDCLCSTLCPHDPFIDASTARRKDRAQQMLFSGRRFRFKFETPGRSAGHRLVSVGWDGLITVEGFGGEYRPDQLEEIE